METVKGLLTFTSDFYGEPVHLGTYSIVKDIPREKVSGLSNMYGKRNVQNFITKLVKDGYIERVRIYTVSVGHVRE